MGTVRNIFYCWDGDVLEFLARQKEMELVWVPGHMRVPGNDRADQLARLEPGESCQGPKPILGISRGCMNGALNKWASQIIGMR
ncbi:hypothetical protein NQ315_014042 [Exocentrus adspersus]|uniref:RNase H type-1 domain-containing protein n=1 Tax=Exocentrus adspersus TaxID=1586481 RepID=A0AAV8VX15_9CUCU|nr:hypothetical protein NQ315_014042 [Exocentrus adspersus]